MSFEPNDTAVSPEQEWLSRTSVFLTADDPHQACVRRAFDTGTLDINLVCQCPTPPCTKECCT